MTFGLRYSVAADLCDNAPTSRLRTWRPAAAALTAANTSKDRGIATIGAVVMLAADAGPVRGRILAASE